MSNINNNMQTQTSNTLHNAIMEAGSRDCPSMLAPGNYIQWKSRIKHYIDTKPNQELIHFCLTNPPYELGWKDKPILDSEGNPTTTTQQPEWQRFVTLMKQSQALKHVSYHKLYDILKQHQHEMNEIRAEKIARVANLLALDNSPRIHINAGCERQRTGNVAGARETISSSMVQKSGIQCYNCKEYGHVERECQKPKRVK
nr:Gag-Pol polyprotein [Tanacetum cinerariifolium]